MADQITDNRTLLTSNDTTANIDDATGSPAGNQNTETFIEGTASTSEKLSNASGGLLYDAGTAQNWSNNTFYIWWNVSTAGKLNTLAAGGVRVRFCGATVTDFFEIYIAGADTYTGGFDMAVVDVERARQAAVVDADPNTNTGGTPPATTAIRYVGMFFDVVAMISGNVDNVFIDAIWRLPANTPGIIVEGQNGGTTPWTFFDIFDAGDPGDTTKAWGTGFVESNGSFSFNTPIQIGINDATNHVFTDSNALVGWQDQFVDLNDFYEIALLGGAGGVDFTLGSVSGSGNDRVGTQGGTIFAAADGPRWGIDASDTDTNCNLYGVQMIHGNAFTFNNAGVSVVGSTWLDCTSALVTGADLLGCNIIDANTADGVAFMTTTDMGDLINCAFVFSDGHAIELTTPQVSSQTSNGNTFTGYGLDGTNDAAVYNNSGSGLVTINVTGGVPAFTVRNGALASTDVVVSVDIEINGLTEGSRAIFIGSGGAEDGNVLLAGYADSTGAVSSTFGGTTPQNVRIRARNGGIINAAIQDDGGVFTDFTNDARSLTTSPGTGVTNDVDLTPATPAVNDAFYFAGLAQFAQVEMNITTAGSGYSGTWEYWNGAWTALTVTDGTSGFQTSGNGLLISFTAPNDWATTTVNTQGPFYYIRYRITAVTTPTQAQADSISLDKTDKYLPFDATGTITASGLTTTAVWLLDSNNQI